ncbi:MAG: peptidase S10 [Acidobacteriota bacterium]
MRVAFWSLVLALCIPGLGMAKKETAKPSPKPESAAAKETKESKARAVSTHHTVTIEGKPVAYTATAGTIILHNEKDQPTAKIFYIAYTKDHVSDPATRPVTFSYNGGPGGASALVDVGGFCPRKVVWAQPGSTVSVRPPYKMEQNPATLLATTDLVFIDAAGTGYSRLLPPHGTPKMFYGVKQDRDAFTQFIEQYISKYDRWGSPKFLLGESYGTTRSAVLANELIQHGIYLNGVVLCSTVLNFPTITFAPGDDLPFILFLPSYAATAWYHHRLNPEPKSLPELVRKAEAFAEGPYATALFKGSLGEADQLTGRYDSRYTLDELQPLLPFNGPSSMGATASSIMGALTASFNDYVERKLNYHSDHRYRQLSYKVNSEWDWKYNPPVQILLGEGGMYLNVAPALARAMDNDPGLEVMDNNGYFDMATPFFATEYTLRHAQLPKGAWKRITTDYYRCGHMLYLNPKVLPVLCKNINHFIAQASSSH